MTPSSTPQIEKFRRPRSIVLQGNIVAPFLRPPTQDMSIVIVDQPASLTAYIPDLNALASSAVEPNVFYEPCMLMPSLEFYGNGKKFIFVLIFGRDASQHSRLTLCGFFPLQLQNNYHGMPLKWATLWNYLHLNWCTPLLRKGSERKCLLAFFNWLQSQKRKFAFAELQFVAGDGPFHQTLTEVLAGLGLVHSISSVYTRAFLRRTTSAENYLMNALPGLKRKEFRRQERRLAELGNLVYSQLTPQDDVSAWIAEFLALESRGWKGRAGTALASRPEDKKFFTAAATRAFANGQLMMLATHLDGQPIAYKCNFLTGNGGFAFKIAYDECYRNYSPGVHLEIENIRRIHSQSQIEWMDSCATPQHFMANRLWTNRRTIQTNLISTGAFSSALLVSAMLLWRRASQKFHPQRRKESIGTRSSYGIYRNT